MIDLETWVILAERCAAIRKLREEREQPDVTLAFDKHDQARIVLVGGHEGRSDVGSVAVPERVEL